MISLSLKYGEILIRHSGARRNPDVLKKTWMPVFTGMTIYR
jgi:hypothetical protein